MRWRWWMSACACGAWRAAGGRRGHHAQDNLGQYQRHRHHDCGKMRRHADRGCRRQAELNCRSGFTPSGVSVQVRARSLITTACSTLPSIMT